MADLLTHYVSARLTGVAIRDRVTLALFAGGVLLPDLLGKPIGAFPGTPHMADIPSHTLTGLIFACLALSMLFSAPIRARAFFALYFGSLLHLVLDSMKDYLGSGSVWLLHPFSLRTFEYGVYRSEDVLYLLPLNLAILAILWVARRRRASASPRSADVTVP